MSKAINLNSFEVTDFQKMFNMTDGKFDTVVDKTHGKMTLTAGGKLRNIGRYDSGIINYSGREETGRSAKENYRVRYALVQALKNGGASKDWIGKFGLLESTDAAFNASATAKPLSRRTIKNILTKYQEMRSGNPVSGAGSARQSEKQAVGSPEKDMKASVVQPEENLEVNEDAVETVRKVIDDHLGVMKSNVDDMSAAGAAIGGVVPAVMTIRDKCNEKRIELSPADADAIIKQQVSKKTNFGEMLKKVRESVGEDGMKARKMLLEYQSQVQRLGAKNHSEANLLAAIIKHVGEGAPAQKISANSVNEAVEKEVKVDEVKNGSWETMLQELEDSSFKAPGTKADVEFVIGNVSTIAMKVLSMRMPKLTPGQAKDIIEHLVKKNGVFASGLEEVKNDVDGRRLGFIKNSQQKSTSAVMAPLLAAIVEHLKP